MELALVVLGHLVNQAFTSGVQEVIRRGRNKDVERLAMDCISKAVEAKQDILSKHVGTTAKKRKAYFDKKRYREIADNAVANCERPFEELSQIIVIPGCSLSEEEHYKI